MTSFPQTQQRESLAVDVVEVVADYEDVDSVSLPPLAQTINPDALDALFETTSETNSTETHVSLEYGDHTVTVYPDHTISIE